MHDTPFTVVESVTRTPGNFHPKQSYIQQDFYAKRDILIEEWISNLSEEDQKKLDLIAEKFVDNLRVKHDERHQKLRGDLPARKGILISPKTAKSLLVLLALRDDVYYAKD